MIIGVLKEIKPNEYRVAAVPATVTEIVRHGHTVYVESGAGLGSGYSDSDYQAAGAIIADTDTVWENADLFYKVKELFPQEFKWMNKDKILFTYIHSNAHPDETDTLLGSHVSAVAYDQLRYLKNKDTITEEGLKASDLLKRIATDFRLNLGTVEDTGYTLETIVEENQTLFDMIQSALDETLMNTKQLYVLYDDAGKLTLKNINTMKLNLLIDEETGENFSYESSIDEQTYNKIKLAYNDEKTGKRELFIAQDGAKMNQWGVLQYFEEVQTKTGASAKADALLKLYDQKTRKLTIQNAFGDVRVRAGSAVVVALNLGDIVTNNYMVVNKVTHTFRGDEHMMELDLIGGEFIA